ncbi:MAG: type II toxin-antitoxin system RelE/ParE family toxin [Myxococcales bacterium]|nr:type II toxin-antitoxin system RelE/ParE family toxin [Myxococcales bacterium]
MNRYAVELTDTALAAIMAQAEYIAIERREPPSAERWLQQVWDAVDSLERLPRRCALAEEDADAPYEVRHVLVSGPALLFTIDDERRTVWVIALRGEGRLPRPEALPSSHDAIAAERKKD